MPLTNKGRPISLILQCMRQRAVARRPQNEGLEAEKARPAAPACLARNCWRRRATAAVAAAVAAADDLAAAAAAAAAASEAGPAVERRRLAAGW